MEVFFVGNGRVAERLGRGLQNLVQRFESALDLIWFYVMQIEKNFYICIPFFIILW